MAEKRIASHHSLRRLFGVRETTADKIFNAVLHLVLFAILIVVLYPLLFVVIASVSDSRYVNSGAMLLWPRGFTLMGYELAFRDARIFTGYYNTIIYTVLGTLLATAVNVMAGYALSRKDVPGRSVIMGLMVFTMYFGGGLIPFYMVVQSLHLMNTRTILILLGGTSVYNIIIVRSFFNTTLPRELFEAASIDGCGNGRFFVSIVLPLSKAIIAVIALYCAVGQWNSYFNAMIFLTDRKLFPLQLYLRDILLVGKSYESAEAMSNMDPSVQMKMQTMSEVVKYGVIVISTLPIIAFYPFLQKYFVQGVMIGSVKG